MPNLDRFAQGLPDPQDEKELFCCDHCGAEIYEGDDYYSTGPNEYACSESCALELAGIELRVAGE